MRISGWRSDVCSSDLLKLVPPSFPCRFDGHREQRLRTSLSQNHHDIVGSAALGVRSDACGQTGGEFVQEWFAVPIGSERGGKIRTIRGTHHGRPGTPQLLGIAVLRSEEHTSELQSLMRNSYAVL